ncbi:hypothetical protein SLEP1_g46026 [Rubroshorea leprosula]|uniref:Uncharacterized protein n=1 Tax=Rubroshorea leprosula TaxID=152421 RepID=A0AAV5LKX1_9ROSI|nr:hypothetical protein SLEP1_g46026 [Rubroshorea leprosula]
MLMLGDFDRNSVQLYTDSPREVFKQTMLQQEIIFRNQVQELHRLYGIQKTIMKNIGSQKLETYSSSASAQPLGTRFPSNSMDLVGLRAPVGQEFLEGYAGNYHNSKPRPPDLQLLADQSVSHVGNGNTGNHLTEIPDLNCPHQSNGSDVLELRLSLNLEVDNRRKENTRTTWFNQKTSSCSPIVIDLEESDEMISIDDARHGPLDFAAPTTYFGGQHDSQVSITSDPFIFGGMKKDASHVVANMEKRKSNQDKCSTQGYVDCPGNAHNNLSAWKQPLISCEVGRIDLNKVQLDDLSCFSNDPVVAHPSTASSIGDFNRPFTAAQDPFCPTTIEGKVMSKISSETVAICQHDDDLSPASVSPKREDNRTDILVGNAKIDGIWEGGVSLKELKSVSRAQIDLCEDIGNSSQSSNENDNSIVELQNCFVHGTNPQVRCEKAEADDTVLCSDQSQITVEEHGSNSFDKHLSIAVADNDSSSGKTMQSGNPTLPASDQFSGTNFGSEVVEKFLGEQDQKSSGSSEPNPDFNKNEKLGEVDVLIEEAAQSLIKISMENSACNQNLSTKAVSNEMENEEEQPQCSFDSYELLALKLTESSADDYSVSSKPFELSDSERKDFSCKLRRGRRLKDFQRDILPGLSSLSRQEIREDINILEAVLRSREYKKMRSNVENAGSWSTPVRSRRSRVNYGGRRKCR